MPDPLIRDADGHQLRLTHLEKSLYPQTGFSKGEVLAYYETVAPVLLPQLRDRVVTRIRYPNGIGGERIFERHAPTGMPAWIRKVTISASPGTGKPAKRVTYPLLDDLAGLLWMANTGALELHTPQWRAGPRGGIGKPDRLVFDLDPGEGIDLAGVAAIAHIVAGRLREEGLEPLPVTSGSKGIHVYAASDGRTTALRLHAFAQAVARELAAAHPDRIVATAAKHERAGKIFIDWSQNHPAKSTATPYTLRGKASPTVAAPRSWDEIGPGINQLGPGEVLARLARDGDLFSLAQRS